MKICSLRNENPLENADFKFSVNNEGEDVNKKPRSRRNNAQHSEGNADVTAFWAPPRLGHPHSQIPSVFGIPFSYYCSVLGIPRYPPGMPKFPSVLVIPSTKILDLAGKSKTFQRWIPLNIEIISSILKRRFIRKALQSKTKRLCENLPKSSNMAQYQSPCSTWPRRRMAQRFDDLLSQRKRKRESSKSTTLLLFLDMPAATILLRKSKSDFTGLTTTRTRWKWLVTNFIYFPMHPLDRGQLKMPALIIGNIR